MNHLQNKSCLGWKIACAAVWLAAVWLAAVCAWGGIVTPLYVGNLTPILDQNGKPLEGPDAAPEFRSRVEIRTASEGIIFPPSATGAAHPNNPMLNSNSVCGVGMNASEPGYFAMVLPLRPVAGTKVFGRAFNAPTLAESSFYADSAVVSAPATSSSMVLSFGPAKPLDPGDADGDGLNNSWEKALGIDDRLTDDYDGDGMSDLFEMRAGSAPDDVRSQLAFMEIQGAAGGSGGVRVKWQSVPGKKYQIEFAPSMFAAQVFTHVSEIVTADVDEYELEMVVVVPVFDAGVFRIRLVEEEVAE